MVYAFIDLISLASKVYSLVIIGRVILSWVNPDPRNAIAVFIVRVTEPVLGPVRRVIPALGGLDFSPILVLIGIQVLESVVVRVLLGMAGG